MFDGLTTEALPPRSRTDRATRWLVRCDGTAIGSVLAKKIGRSSSRFYEGFVHIDGKTISIELSTDLEERCDTILQAWLDPSSNVHTRYALRIPDA